MRSTYPLVVDNLNNGGQLAGVWSCADEDHSADLHEFPRRGLDIDIGGHGEDCLQIRSTVSKVVFC